MTPEELSAAVAAALHDASDAGQLGTTGVALPDTVAVTRPKNREHGDWATNVALQFGKRLGMAPRDLAGVLAARIGAVPGVASVDVAGPGFLNITLEASSAGVLARTIVEAGTAYGRGDRYAGRRVNLEFVSANPTGPIHLGGTRWAAVGDSLARVLQACGADVTREYYFNDHGTQIDRFARSLLARAKGEPAPEDGYGGQYIADIAEAVEAEVPDVLVTAAGERRDDAEAQEIFRARGVELMFAEIKKSLHDFGVDFDVYFHEQSLFESGAVDAAVEQLKASGELYFSDGAWWLRSTDFGDDKDRVVIKSDGNAAYIAGDLAYFRDKRARGFDLCIYMLGADHHGYVARLKAGAAAFGDDPDTVEVLIGQLVNLMRDGKPVRMSKRAGTVVTLEDLVEAVGVDAARYALVRSSADSSLNVDLDLLVKHTNDNPVYYVQYAHARTSAVDRRAADAGVTRAGGFDPATLSDPSEAALLGHLGDFPRTVRDAAEFREPHRVARYLETLAGLYHKWYDACRVLPVGDEPVTDLHRSRLWLNDAARQVLENGLGMLGVSAPERM